MNRLQFVQHILMKEIPWAVREIYRESFELRSKKKNIDYNDATLRQRLQLSINLKNRRETETGCKGSALT